MIDKKKLVKSLIIISLIIIIIIVAIQIRSTLARYETTTETDRDVDVAFWIVDNSFKSDRLLLKDIQPSSNVYEYTFTVSNFDIENQANIAETDLEYEIVLTTTTNLPLSYEIQRNGTTYTGITERLYEDTDGTWYREIKFGTTENPYPLSINTIQDDGTGKYVKTRITDTYILKVTFPTEYSANQNYADLIEYVKIDLSARQKIAE